MNHTSQQTAGQPRNSILIDSVGVCIPTLNAGSNWIKSLSALKSQSIQAELLIIDSGSSDQTVELATDFGCKILQISRTDFNHGSTRNKAVKALGNKEIVVFLTQDAILSNPKSIENIVHPFNDNDVSVVTGRQLPHIDATPIAAHARTFNYPASTYCTDRSDIETLGIKAAFCSNSFSAFRISAFNEQGGFPDNVILGEDMYLAAKLLLKGHKVVYSAEATVYHSHNYTLLQEAQRYFDIGVFHRQEPWILKGFSGPVGEGIRFVASELRFLSANAPRYIPEALIRTVLKLAAYHLGKHYKSIPKTVVNKLSMHHSFWK